MRTPKSPKSPTRGSRRPRRNTDGIPGMLVAPRPKVKPIEEMDMNELRALFTKNESILSSPSASSSNVATRVSAEQSQIRARIWELERKEMDKLQKELNAVAIVEDTDMAVDSEEPTAINGLREHNSTVNGRGPRQGNEPARVSARALAKQRALQAWGTSTESSKTETMPLQEALELEKRSFEIERERQRRIQEKKEKWGCHWPQRDQPMTREEREARIWAFMNYKPTDSDLEDEEDEDEDDDDPASWFHDDQDDGLKGQDIVYPDPEELAYIIRVDDSQFNHQLYGSEDVD